MENVRKCNQRASRPFLARWAVPCALSLVCVAASVGRAAPVINVGNFTLQPNTAGQTISISVSNATAAASQNIQGEDFRVQIGNGQGTAPSITAVDIVTGTIFGSNNNGQVTPAGGNFPQAQARSVQTQNGFIDANGKLATLTISTVGVSSGTFSLSLGAGSTRLGATSFFDGVGNTIAGTSITDGSITIAVPEPAALGLLALGLHLLLRRRAAKAIGV